MEKEIEIPIKTNYRDILRFLGIEEDENGISNNVGISGVSATIPAAVPRPACTVAEPISADNSTAADTADSATAVY